MLSPKLIEHINNADTIFVLEAVSVFVMGNLASEAVKYVGVKAFKKIDGLFHTFLD